jgi:hypothetical protein
MGGCGSKMEGNIARDDTKSKIIRNVAKALLSLNRLYFFLIANTFYKLGFVGLNHLKLGDDPD